MKADSTKDAFVKSSQRKSEEGVILKKIRARDEIL